MSSNLAYRYLEQIQAETYDALDIKIQNALQDPRVLPGYRRIVREFLTAQAGHPVTEQQVEKQLQIYLEQQRDRMKTAPTRFEESNTFSIMSQLNEQIDTVIATHQIPLSAKPIFGTLSTGRVNAVTVAVPRAGGYLVLLERQLFFFALLIGKAVALTFAIESGKDDEPASVLLNRDAAAARLDADDTPIRRFLETVSAYATTGVPTNAPPYVLSDHRYQALSGMLCEAMELFVLGHEYGHVIAGHLD